MPYKNNQFFHQFSLLGFKSVFAQAIVNAMVDEVTENAEVGATGGSSVGRYKVS
ncbi:Putative uncharacterized protein [Moritella viscosa]|uniref:hypothetical protein n=1 Tax=Moritella viscosa TaxID=80854 RepID=UPI0009123553|nr:hypothetical protein [Moritella viscosa]SGZ09422.1 Putative uncharacterized protein [Moritella viscosa]